MKILIVTGGMYQSSIMTENGMLKEPFPDAVNLTQQIPLRQAGAYILKSHLIDAGHDVEILEFIDFWTKQEITQWLEKKRNVKYDCIGYSHTFVLEKRAREMINFFKQHWPDALYVAGSPNYLADIGVDYYVKGYGEHAFVKLLEYHEGKISSIETTPYHNGQLIDAYNYYKAWPQTDYSFKYYKDDYWQENEQFYIELSRGCRFKCPYCNFPLIGIKEDTSASSDSMYEYLKRNYEEFGKKDYIVLDDTANNRTSQLQKLRDAVVRLDFKPTFTGFMRIDLMKAHPEQKELCAEAGFVGHSYGIETLNHQTGKLIGKGMDPMLIKETMHENVEYFESVGHKKIYIDVNLVAGLPKETIDSMQETQDWFMNNFGKHKHVTWRWHPLHILKDQQGLINAFGLNMTKYGYEEVVENSGVQFKNESIISAIKEWTINWRNEFTNFTEVSHYSDQWNKETVSSFKRIPSAWRHRFFFNDEDRIHAKFIQDYKLSKILLE